MRDGRRRDRRLAADVLARVPARVTELDRRFRAALVQGVGQPRQSRNEAVVVDAELVKAMPADLLGRRHLDGDEPVAAAPRAPK